MVFRRELKCKSIFEKTVRYHMNGIEEVPPALAEMCIRDRDKTLASMALKSDTTNLYPGLAIKAVRISCERVSGTSSYKHFQSFIVTGFYKRPGLLKIRNRCV